MSTDTLPWHPLARRAGLLALVMGLMFVGTATAGHVPPQEIAWACGFGGGGTQGHPSNCGINPIGGGFEVGEAGPPVWGDAWTDGDEAVLGIVLGGEARAIPVVMLDSHEIANIVVGGIPVAVTYCPLCGSGVAFLREVTIAGQTQTLDFTASGFLYQSDLVMWDPQTGTLWNQILGESIASLLGEQVSPEHPDVALEVVPMLVTTWGAWHAEYPDAAMLQKVRASYSYPYGGYERDDRRCGLEGCRGADARLHPKELVLGLAEPGPIAFRTAAVDALGGVLLHSVGGRDLVVAGTPAGGHRVLDATGLGLSNGTGVWVDVDGVAWDLLANQAADGRSMEELPSLRLYWFAWAEHHPSTELWGADESTAIKKDNGKLLGFTIPLVVGLLLAGAWWLRRS